MKGFEVRVSSFHELSWRNILHQQRDVNSIPRVERVRQSDENQCLVATGNRLTTIRPIAPPAQGLFRILWSTGTDYVPRSIPHLLGRAGCTGLSLTQSSPRQSFELLAFLSRIVISNGCSPAFSFTLPRVSLRSE
jgi:hypothetical protein